MPVHVSPTSSLLYTCSLRSIWCSVSVRLCSSLVLERRSWDPPMVAVMHKGEAKITLCLSSTLWSLLLPWQYIVNPLFNFTNCVNVYISPVLLPEKNRDEKKNGGEANELREKTDNGGSCKSRSPSHQTETKFLKNSWAIEKDE